MVFIGCTARDCDHRASEGLGKGKDKELLGERSVSDGAEDENGFLRVCVQGGW